MSLDVTKFLKKNRKPRPPWKKAMFISTPIWIYLLVDTIILRTTGHVILTPAFHVPGWIVSHLFAYAPDYVSVFDSILWLVLNCGVYYSFVLVVISLFARVLDSSRRSAQAPSSATENPGSGQGYQVFGVIGVVVLFLYFGGKLCFVFRMNMVPIQVVEMTHVNPTSHVFAGTPEDIQRTIHGKFEFYEIDLGEHERGGYKRQARYHADTSGTWRNSASVQFDTANQKMVYIHSWDFVGSHTCFAMGDPLTYDIEFLVILKEAGRDSTRVSVMADDPEVLKGIDDWGHSNWRSKSITVESSTIEECKVLYCIGQILGDTSIPYPETPVRDYDRLWWGTNEEDTIRVWSSSLDGSGE